MYLNKVMLMGNLGRDPEMRYTPSGQAVTQATVAVTRRFQKNKEWEESTEWFRLVIWGDSGERFAEKMKKGNRVYVEGRLETRQWEGQDGAKRYTTEVIVQSWQDLEKRSTTNREEPGDDESKPSRRSGGGGSRQQRGEPPSHATEPTEPADDLSDLDDLPF